MSDVSQRLLALLSHGQDDTPVAVNVMLEANMRPSQAESIVKQIAARVADNSDFEYLAKINIVLCTASLQTIRYLATLPGITWIDLESRAPVETIMDLNGN